MDELRDGVRLRAYGQRDPLVEYKREAFIQMFEDLMSRIKSEIAQTAFRATTSLDALQRIMAGAIRKQQQQQRVVKDEVHVLGGGPSAEKPDPGIPATAAARFDRAMEAAMTRPAARRNTPAVGRNEPCPCGSGKKYKKCCGQKP
jgi:preprotein translocase subunit SecA